MADNETIRKILLEYENIRRRNEQLRENRIQDVYARIPEIKEIDQLIADTGLEMTNSVLLQNGDANIETYKRKIDKLSERKKQLLKSFDYPEDFTKLQYDCNHCMDTGYFEGRKCYCFNEKQIKYSYEDSNLQLVMNKENFDNFKLDYYSKQKDESGVSPYEQMSDILKISKKFIKDFDGEGPSLLFFGNPGLGKTFLSSCISKSLLDSGKKVYYQSASNIFDSYEKYYFDKTKQSSHERELNLLLNVDLLIIDDLGTEHINKVTTPFLFKILNHRVVNKKKMIISTNLSLTQLKEIYSERVISRLIGNFLPLKFIGEDIRRYTGF